MSAAHAPRNPTKYPNWWPGWEAAALQAAHLPATGANVTFLANWHTYEGSTAANNPLNVTADKAKPVTVGTSAINKQGVQNYATRQQGAAATAAFLGMPNYTAIRAALASGDPYAYVAKSHGNLQSVVDQLATWGSRSFAVVLGYTSPNPAAMDTTQTQVHVNPDTGATTTTKTKGPTDPISSAIGGLGNWLTSTGKLMLAYVLLIGVAGALLVTGLKGLGVPVPKAPKVVPV